MFFTFFKICISVCYPINTFSDSVLYIILLFSVSTSLSVTVTSSGNNLIGSKYSLLCSVSVSDGESISHIIWFRGANTELEGNNSFFLTLTFPSLSVGDEGTYTCCVEVGTLVKIRHTELMVSSKLLAHSPLDME